MRNLHLETQGKQISVVYIEFTPLLKDENSSFHKKKTKKLRGIHSHWGVIM